MESQSAISGFQSISIGLTSRVGQPQFLDQDRYDKIRTALLQHQIETAIARRIESTYDTGVRRFLYR
jgi:hypothetical protein